MCPSPGTAEAPPNIEIPCALISVYVTPQNGCLVVNAPTANTIAAAEHGIAMLCALTRSVAQNDASVKRGEWKRTKYVGVSLVGKTLAIMGFGKVRPRGLGTALGSSPVLGGERCLGSKHCLAGGQDARRHGLWQCEAQGLTPP